jgi:hypothetical protein
MALLKGILCGLIAALIISFFMLRAGYPGGGVLALHRAVLADYVFSWSWPIFFVIGGIATAIFKLMD